jgi:hypothetical protein
MYRRSCAGRGFRHHRDIVDPHLGRVVIFVRLSPVGHLKCDSIHPVSTTSSESTPVESALLSHEPPKTTVSSATPFTHSVGVTSWRAPKFSDRRRATSDPTGHCSAACWPNSELVRNSDLRSIRALGPVLLLPLVTPR